MLILLQNLNSQAGLYMAYISSCKTKKGVRNIRVFEKIEFSRVKRPLSGLSTWVSLYLLLSTRRGEQQLDLSSLDLILTLSSEHLGVLWNLGRLLLYALAGVQLVKQLQSFREVWRRSGGITGCPEWLKTVRVRGRRTALGLTQKQAQGGVKVPLGFREHLVSLIPGSPTDVDELIDHDLLS